MIHVQQMSRLLKKLKGYFRYISVDILQIENLCKRKVVSVRCILFIRLQEYRDLMGNIPASR